MDQYLEEAVLDGQNHQSPSSGLLRYKIVSWRELRAGGWALMETHAREFKIPDLVAYLGPEDEILASESRGDITGAMAWLGQTPIGYMAWKLAWHNGLGTQAAHLGPWFVEKPWRGRGVAQGLLRICLESLKYKGCRWGLVVLPIRGRRRPGPWGQPFETTYLIDIFARLETRCGT